MYAKFERALSILLTASATVIAALLFHREFIAAAPVAARSPSQSDPPTYMRGWENLLPMGIRVGSADAPIKVIEFTDLECPFCRRFQNTLNDALRTHGDQVAYFFVHYPLSQHKLAYPAARAAECANRQDVFKPFVDAIFQKQDSLGTRSWEAYGKDAGISDSITFSLCARDTLSIKRIEQGIALGRQIEITGTPTVIVNGWRFATTPPDSQFGRVVVDLLAGHEPFGRVRKTVFK
jgi:predicted DsbA family dithiol-disulfide isomerase